MLEPVAKWFTKLTFNSVMLVGSSEINFHVSYQPTLQNKRVLGPGLLNLTYKIFTKCSSACSGVILFSGTVCAILVEDIMTDEKHFRKNNIVLTN